LLSWRQLKIVQIINMNGLHLFKGILVLTPSEEKLSYVVLKAAHMLLEPR
jgi:hypothetical protein